jgi:hypothetical protein
MFRALLAHPQEVPHKRRLVYCVRIMSVGCGNVAVKHMLLFGQESKRKGTKWDSMSLV